MSVYEDKVAGYRFKGSGTIANGYAWIYNSTTKQFELTDLSLTYAPTTPDYLVGTAQAGLSAEIVVGTAPGGELGGTWASPTVDTTHSGSAHSAWDHDSVISGADTQQIAFWDSFDGLPAALPTSRYVSAASGGGGAGGFAATGSAGRTAFDSGVPSTTTGAVSGGAVTNTFTPRSAENWIFKAIIGRTTNPVGGTQDDYLGFRASLATGLVDGIYFRKTDTGNWFLVCRSAGVETTKDMLVLGSTEVELEFRITGAGTSVQGYLNGAAIVTAITTNIPTGLMNVVYLHDNRAATVTTGGRMRLFGWGWKGDIVP